MIPGAKITENRIGVALVYGFLCHGLFVVGVGAMIVMMFFGMSHSIGVLRAPWSVAANVLLLLQFPLLHSFLLSKHGNAVLYRLAPALFSRHLVTTTYAMVASAQVLALFLLWSPSGTVWWMAHGFAMAIMCCLYAAAWLLLLKAITDAGFAQQVGLLGWLAVARGVAPKYPPMPRGGLFRLCRQPIYVAFALTLWTVPTWTPDQLAVAITLTLYCLAGPLFKEGRFTRRFGAEFDAYRRQVPYWLPWPQPAADRAAQRRDRPTRSDLSIYDSYADAWWDGRTRWLRVLQNMVPARLAQFDSVVANWRGLDVLDIGCGGGFMAEALTRRGARVLGVDPSAPAIAAAARHASGLGLSIEYQVGSGERLPVAERSFDAVVCVDVLEHVDDVDRVIAEVMRVLKPGGVFLFDTINRNWLAALIMVHAAETVIRLLPRGTHDPSCFIRPSELKTKLTRAGLMPGSFIGFGPRGLNSKFDFTFGRLPTCAIMYMGHATNNPAPAKAAAVG